MKPFFSVLASLAMMVSGIHTASAQYTISDRTRTVIDSTYNALIKKHKVVGASLAVVDHGKLVYAAGYGFADRAAQVKATEKTIYRIGSCTKSFTALSIMQLQEKGLVNIDSSVKVYLPELKISSRFNDDNKIYVRDMLAHISGLPCDILNGFFCDAPPDINWVINELNKQTTMSPRRYKHAYSNVAYGLLGEVVARSEHSSYSTYVQEHIFKPLHMNSSFITYDTKLGAGFSKGYVDNKEIKEPLIRDQAAGLIHSNVLDMANYLGMYLGRGSFNGTTIVSDASLKEMEKNQLSNTLLSSNSNWGFGLYSKTLKVEADSSSSEVTLIGHGGDTYAFHADFAYLPEQQVGVVILTNTDKGGDINDAADLLKLYLKEAQDKKLITRYTSPTDTLAGKNPLEQPCRNEEALGLYNFGPLVMRAHRTNRITFMQGPVKLVMKPQKKDSIHYSMTAKVFKVVPIKVKGQAFSFVRLNNNIYLKGDFTKSKKYSYMAVRSTITVPASAWKDKLGTYKPVGKVYACTDCPYTNFEDLSMTLSRSGDLVCLKTRAKSKDTKSTYYLNLASDKQAFVGGIGRGTGDVVQVLENGHIYYSGFEFEKVK